MRVLFFNSHNTWVPHLETEMELMTVHHQSGDELYQVYCNASFPVCDSNLNHDLSICNSCTGRRKSAIEILNFEVKDFMGKH